MGDSLHARGGGLAIANFKGANVHDNIESLGDQRVGCDAKCLPAVPAGMLYESFWKKKNRPAFSAGRFE
jgi:hypothetical protein